MGESGWNGYKKGAGWKRVGVVRGWEQRKIGRGKKGGRRNKRINVR